MMKNLSFISTTTTEDNCTYKLIAGMNGIHAGKPAFIIGNGPSLSETDPKKIDNQCVTLAGNGIVSLEYFVPDYYFAIDQNAIRMWSEKISRLNTTKLFSSHLKEFIDIKYPKVSHKKNVYFPLCYERAGDFEINKWEKLGFESGQTVVCPMIQFAMLMKCDPIYIIGVDLSYGSTKNYFTDNYHPAWIPAYRQSETSILNQRISRGIERLAKACRVAGIRLYNCAPTRNLPFLEELDFDKARAQAGEFVKTHPSGIK